CPTAKLPMTDKLPKLATSWQRAMVSDWLTQHPKLSAEQGYRLARSRILQLLVLYQCEQRGLLRSGRLLTLQENPSIDAQLLQLWQTLKIPWIDHDVEQEMPSSDALLSPLIRSLYRVELQPELGKVAILGQIYETLLAAAGDRAHHAQKSGGIYYTPEAIVAYILQNTLSPLLLADRFASPAGLTLLDPSCGGGVFLLLAYQFLLEWHLQLYLARDRQQGLQNGWIEQNPGGQWRLSLAERSRILLSHLYGVDIDPQAVALTRLALWLKLWEGMSDRGSLPSDPPLDLSHNVQCGNAVIGSDFYIEGFGQLQERDRVSALDWTQAFPAILQAGGFDLVFGNPPYLDSERMAVHLADWRRYCTAKYATATGNWDLFCVFIEQALRLCKPGGYTSLVVPNKLASANYAAKARSLLMQQTQLLALRDYSSVPAFQASVYPLVYVAQKRSPAAAASVRYEQMQSLDRVRQSGQLFDLDGTRPWRIGVVLQQTDWIDRVTQGHPKLGDLAHVTGAATVAEAYALQPWIQNGTAKLGDLKLVNSGTIDRYSWLWGKKPLRYLGQTYLYPIIPAEQIAHLPPKRRQQAQQPKIMVAGLSQVLECAVDTDGSVLAGKSTSVIQASPLDLRYLLGLLNSHLLSVYFGSCFGGNRLQGGYLRIGAPQLRQLPIPVPADAATHYEQVIAWVDDRLQLQQQIQQHPSAAQETAIAALEAAIDQQVYKLYGLTDLEVKALTTADENL
ncbi:MAG TPA: DNA methyltransferase, partial [Coleofasciculaceae cyanobacterium]